MLCPPRFGCAHQHVFDRSGYGSFDCDDDREVGAVSTMSNASFQDKFKHLDITTPISSDQTAEFQVSDNLCVRAYVLLDIIWNDETKRQAFVGMSG